MSLSYASNVAERINKVIGKLGIQNFLTKTTEQLENTL